MSRLRVYCTRTGQGVSNTGVTSARTGYNVTQLYDKVEIQCRRTNDTYTLLSQCYDVQLQEDGRLLDIVSGRYLLPNQIIYVEHKRTSNVLCGLLLLVLVIFILCMRY